MSQSETLLISAEELAYWYFRLNGFMTIPNFVVHPDDRAPQRTDVDILGVRFPYRCELIVDPMIDDDIFTVVNDRPFIIIAEVKRGQCRLNGPWRNKKAGNMVRIMRAIGCASEAENNSVADSLYDEGFFNHNKFYISLIAIGSRESGRIPKDIPQITWGHIKRFMYHRYNHYRDQKCSNFQWDRVGQELYSVAIDSRNQEEFTEKVVLDN